MPSALLLSHYNLMQFVHIAKAVRYMYMYVHCIYKKSSCTHLYTRSANVHMYMYMYVHVHCVLKYTVFTYTVKAI